MLTKVAIFYEQEVDAALESLTAAIEPVMIVFLGGIVCFIVVAMFMPMVAVIQSLSLDRSTEGHRVADFDMMAAEALGSEDLQEGMRAFKERRKPQFKGS